MSRLPLILGAGLLALAACSREPAPAPALENETVTEEPAAAAAPEPAPPPEPVVEERKEAPPVDTNDADVPEPVDESAQTQEDADAVGMTTRATPPSNDENEAPPALGNDSGA